MAILEMDKDDRDRIFRSFGKKEVYREIFSKLAASRAVDVQTVKELRHLPQLWGDIAFFTDPQAAHRRWMTAADPALGRNLAGDLRPPSCAEIARLGVS